MRLTSFLRNSERVFKNKNHTPGEFVIQSDLSGSCDDIQNVIIIIIKNTADTANEFKKTF